MERAVSLTHVYEGWEGYQTSLIRAVTPLTVEQLAWRPAPNQRSVGELVRHICLGRITWFARLKTDSSLAVAAQVPAWFSDDEGNRYANEQALEITEDVAALVQWLELSWQIIDDILTNWTVADLSNTYRHTWNRDLYDVSHQWTIWRIMTHDVHHGGELSLMLGLQGIEAFELSALGGHITMPALAQE
jgi:uncharacterized damage-inducible protein DinB